MDLMTRRRALMRTIEEPDIPIGVEYVDFNSPDTYAGYYLYPNSGNIGQNASTVRQNVSGANAVINFCPFNSDYVFNVIGGTGSTTITAFLCDENYIVWAICHSNETGASLQTIAKNAEEQYGVKLKWYRFSSVSARLGDFTLLSYKRIS